MKEKNYLVFILMLCISSICTLCGIVSIYKGILSISVYYSIYYEVFSFYGKMYAITEVLRIANTLYVVIGTILLIVGIYIFRKALNYKRRSKNR